MRKIEIEPDLSVRFLDRGREFDDGVEVGFALAQMASGRPRFSRRVGAGAVRQLEAVAKAMSYRLRVLRSEDGGATIVELERTDQRPALRVVTG